MDKWVLGIQIDGEWEHCTFSDRSAALKTFAAVSLDYKERIERAVITKFFPASRLRLLPGAAASSLLQ